VNKKLGPLPLWVWVAVGGTLAYIVWKFGQNQEPETGVEGYYPAERAEPPEGEVGPGPLGGLAELSEAISALGAAGFVPAGSEEAQGLPPEQLLEPRIEPPGWWEELSETIVKEKLLGGRGKGRGRGKAKGKGKRKARGRGKPKGRGKRGAGKGRGKGRGKGAKGGRKAQSRAPSSKAPRHTARPNHGAARAPRSRLQAQPRQHFRERQHQSPRPRPKARPKAPRPKARARRR
jgi:hypothetical protein